MYLIQDYSYELPEEFIAQEPVKKRDSSRLLFLDKNSGNISHHIFHDIYDLLSLNDILVINNTQVIKGRLTGYKKTGGKAEILILNYASMSFNEDNIIFECLLKTAKRPALGSIIYFDSDLFCEVIDFNNSVFKIKFKNTKDFESKLFKIGKIPLPPYIKRDNNKLKNLNDESSYQTVYATQKGAIAAPTAGLHFSYELLEKLKSKGIKIVEITLHVGYGTFLPVRTKDIREHKMHPEWYYISDESADELNKAKFSDKKIIAVGTTSLRTLEFSSDEKGFVFAGNKECDLFIYPGYKFKVVDALITNFHLPQSTLLMLISAFAGREKILNAYKEAIKEKYRFYSYGDAMLIM